jgi:DNA gyrase subunit A
LVNLLPELGADTVTTVLPLPQDETLWDSLHLVFGTSLGNVRRNRLSDFRNVRSSGLIAMKLDEGDHLIGVATCREGDDVLLATRNGRCIRFQLSDDTVRVFAGRDSTGVRGIRLLGKDAVISLSVLRHVESSIEERAAYLRIANAKRRANGNGGDEEAAAAIEGPTLGGPAIEGAGVAGPAVGTPAAEGPELEGPSLEGDEPAAEVALSAERIADLEAAEELLLTVTDMGFGKRSSAYEYRVTGRGGQGIANITLAPRNGTAVVATLPVRSGDDVMMVTDAGRLIRVPADQVRITGRQAMGVTLFRVIAGEHVTSVFPVIEDETEENGGPDSAPQNEGEDG